MALEESATTTQGLLEQLIKRFDEQTVVGDQRHAMQAAFNAQVSQELQSVRKQLDLTQADVDEAHRVGSPALSPTGSTILDARALPSVAPAAVRSGQARLINDGPPLIKDLPPVALGAQQQQPQPPPIRRNSEYDFGDRVEDGGYIKPPKHDFPRFDGSLPNLWLDRGEAYFGLYRVSLQQWVTTASLYMEGHAALWLQAYRQSHGHVSWSEFKRAIVEEFGPDEFEVQMHKLLQLRQSGTVAEYRQQFEVYMYHLLSLDSALSPKFFVTQFVLGLKDELRTAVRIQAPTSITRATVFARIQEEELEAARPRHRPVPAGRPPPLPAPIPPRPPAAPKPTADDFGRERQLRDFIKANNLCFKCGDRYSRDHQCKRQAAQLLTIQVGEFGEVLTDDAIHALELLAEPEPVVEA
jgi:hypothetical protein